MRRALVLIAGCELQIVIAETKTAALQSALQFLGWPEGFAVPRHTVVWIA